MAMKNGLTESLVINVTATVSPSGTGARAPPLPAAALPDAPPLVALLVPPPAAADVELVVVVEPLLHAVTTRAAATPNASGINRFVGSRLSP
jgi:hypothetical protein